MSGGIGRRSGAAVYHQCLLLVPDIVERSVVKLAKVKVDCGSEPSRLLKWHRAYKSTAGGSPPAIVAIAPATWGSILSLTTLAEPSHHVAKKP